MLNLICKLRYLDGNGFKCKEDNRCQICGGTGKFPKMTENKCPSCRGTRTCCHFSYCISKAVSA